MIKARLSNGVIILGIDAENIKRLLNKEPIGIDLSELGGSDRIIIMAAPTLAEVQADLDRVTKGNHIVTTHNKRTKDKTKH